MLFTRSTREVALTELGAAWLPKVHEALHRIDSAVDDLIALSAHYRRIRLGYLIGTGADLLFRLVRHFEVAHPEITVEPREFDFNDPTAGLADGPPVRRRPAGHPSTSPSTGCSFSIPRAG